MFRAVRRIPFFKILAVAQVALLARRHVVALTPIERRRFAELVRHGHHLSAPERRELRDLLMKLEPRAFAVNAADHMSPFPLPKRMLGGRRRR
jgi:hypothetical protein